MTSRVKRFVAKQYLINCSFCNNEQECPGCHLKRLCKRCWQNCKCSNHTCKYFKNESENITIDYLLRLEQTGMTILPTVWSYIPFQQRFQFLYVQKQLRDLSIRMNHSGACPVNVTLKRDTNMVPYFNAPEELQVRYLSNLVNSFPVIFSLNLRNFKYFQRCGVSLMFLYCNPKICKYLQQLSVCIDCDESLIGIKNLYNLTNLDLSVSLNLSNNGLMHLSSLIGLKKLTLGRCMGIDSNGFKHIASLINLTSLNISGNFAILVNTGDFVLLPVMPQMQQLYLRGCCNGIQYIDICNIISLFSNLVVLDISYCHHIDDNYVNIISLGLQKLKYLDIENCVKVTDNGLLLILQKLRCLQFLNIINIHNVSPIILLELYDHVKHFAIEPAHYPNFHDQVLNYFN